MATKVRPLLRVAMSKLEGAGSEEEARNLAAHFGSSHDDTAVAPQLPVVVQVPAQSPNRGEPWRAYQARVEKMLNPLVDRLKTTMGISAMPLYAANALKLSASLPMLEKIATLPEVEALQLDPIVHATLLDNVAGDIDLGGFRATRPGRDGTGVTVAILDSGIDTQHPHLVVAESVSTCGESTDIPGRHGTHCAGIVASQDTIYCGVAPRARILNVKVLKANGNGTHTNIIKGVDEALNRDADVLSMSLGFNHLPTWSANGHGWDCKDGRCALCVAVDNASALDNKVIVVAAGNEHSRATTLRLWGHAAEFDTELACPGQAREAVTVGAITKATFLAADFSSRGPTADGRPKPDLCAAGVNITSTVPVPRDAHGVPIASPPRAELFDRDSGTSMATPLVAGAAALVIQQLLAAGGTPPWTPAAVRAAVLGAVLMIGLPVNVAGQGRLSLTGLP